MAGVDVLKTEFHGEPADLFAVIKDAHRRLGELTRDRISDVRIRVQTTRAVADATAANATIGATLRDKEVDVRVNTNAAGAVTQAAAADAAIGAVLTNKTVHVDVDRRHWSSAMSWMTTSWTRTLAQVQDRARAMGGISGAADSIKQSFMSAWKSTNGLTGAFGGLAGKALLLVSVLPLIITSISALVGGFFALGSAMAPAMGLFATLPGLFVAAAAGAGTLVLGLGNVFKAVLTGAQADAAGTTETAKHTAATNNLTAAKRAIYDAQRRLNDVMSDYPTDVINAHLDARQAALNEDQAIRQLTLAQKALADAQKKVGDATYTSTQQTDAFSKKIYEVSTQTVAKTKAGMSEIDASLAVRNAILSLAQARQSDSEAQGRLHDLTARGVKGTDAYRDALRALTRAQADLRQQQKQGDAAVTQSVKTVDAYAVAMAKLSPQGRSFVGFLRDEWIPAFADSRREVEGGLLPGMESGLRKFIPTMQQVMTGLAGVGGVISAAFDKAGDALKTDEWQQRIDRTFAVLTPTVGNFLTTIGNVVRGVMDLIFVSDDLTGKVSGGLANATGEWADNMERATAQGSGLRAFFDRAWSAATRTWAVIKNITGSIINLGSTGRKAIGDDLLDSLVKTTQKWQDWTSSAEGTKKISGWFKDMKAPLMTIVGGVESLVTWWSGFNASKFNEQSAALGDMAESFGKILTAFGDSEIITSVLTGLGLIVGLLGTLTEHFGVFGLLAVMAVQKVAFSMLASLGAAIGTSIASFVALQAGHLVAMLGMRAAWIIGLGALGLVIVAIYLIVKHWDKIKEVAQKVWHAVKAGISGFLGWVKENWKKIIPFLFGPIGIAIGLIVKHWDTIKSTISDALGWVRDNWKTIVGVLAGPIGWAVLLIVKHWDKIKATFGKVKDSISEKIDAIKGLFSGLGDALGNLNVFASLKDGFMGVVDSVIALWNSLDFSISVSVPDWVPKIGGKSWSAPDIFPDYTPAAMKEHGGDVDAGQSLIVGERRAEVFVPKVPGRIEPSIPAYLSKTASSAGASGGVTKADLLALIEGLKAARDVTFHVPVQNDMDPKVLSHELGWAMR